MKPNWLSSLEELESLEEERLTALTQDLDTPRTLRRLRKKVTQEGTVLQDQVQTDCQNWCVAHDLPSHTMPVLQTKRHDKLCKGNSPYPGLVNLHNSCAVNALMQCIIHCKPLREHILSIPSPEPSRMCREFKKVVRACTRQSIHVMYVPASMTSLLQPLDTHFFPCSNVSQLENTRKCW